MGTSKMMLMPAAPGRCVHCGADHGEQEPHFWASVFYGMRFKMKWGRNPTHADCVAHLPAQIQRAYREVLPDYALEWTEPDGDPIAEPYAVRSK